MTLLGVENIPNYTAPNVILYTMSPQDHENERFWPPQNDAIYRLVKKPSKSVAFGGWWCIYIIYKKHVSKCHKTFLKFYSDPFLACERTS